MGEKICDAGGRPSATPSSGGTSGDALLRAAVPNVCYALKVKKFWPESYSGVRGNNLQSRDVAEPGAPSSNRSFMRDVVTSPEVPYKATIFCASFWLANEPS